MKITPQKRGRNSYERNFDELIEDHLIPQIKQEMINDKGSKIIELTNDKMILENNREKLIYKRQ